jgi:hypothetical protein
MKKTKSYFLVDLNRNKDTIYKMKVCAAMSEIALTHGYIYGRKFSEELISQYWNHPEPPPSPRMVEKIINTKNIKWYINKHIEVQNKVWNADFLNGLTKSGKVIQNSRSFPSFLFCYNESIEEIINECPFYGMKNNNWNHATEKRYKWQRCPALVLKHSDSSISYLAGVLATGTIKYLKFDEKIQNPKGRMVKTGRKITRGYARYFNRLIPLFEKWNIPIEKRDSTCVYISPFWVALLTPWMPQCCQKWMNVKKPYKAKEYSLIMWKIFTGKDIETDGIPYLISRRAYYYQYGSIKNLERKWVEEKLVEIDSRFKEAVKKWDEGIV